MSDKKQQRVAAARVFQQQNQLPTPPPEPQAEIEEAPAAGFERRRSHPGAPAEEDSVMFDSDGDQAVRSQHNERKRSFAGMMGSLQTSEELQLAKDPLQVRETGFLLWKRVIVPPNVYVVHTRLGRKDPVTLGLGQSFRFNPMTDSYLVVPAAMQTIGVVANCITREKQGINVLAYVQWQISDFSIAYRKLDFSDSRDPLSIVNAQLREQAEAAIKDKIATMSVEDVLTDKAPVIEELTRRLIAVTEGRMQREDNAGNQEGLGIAIVTVQIKEAFVSSTRLWENLQAPFRHEQQKSARLSYLAMQEEIRARELESRRAREISEAETTVEIERVQQTSQTEGMELRLAEEEKRFAREQETTRQKIQLEEETTLTREESARRLEAERARQEQAAQLAQLTRDQERALEKSRLDAESRARETALQIEQQIQQIEEQRRLDEREAEEEEARLARATQLKAAEFAHLQQVNEQEAALTQQTLTAKLAQDRQEAEAEATIQATRNAVEFSRQEQEAQIARLYQEIRNLVTERDIQQRFIEALPELAENMPDVQEMRVIQMSGDGSPANAFMAQLLALYETVRDSVDQPPGNPDAAE